MVRRWVARLEHNMQRENSNKRSEVPQAEVVVPITKVRVCKAGGDARTTDARTTDAGDSPTRSVGGVGVPEARRPNNVAFWVAMRARLQAPPSMGGQGIHPSVAEMVVAWEQFLHALYDLEASRPELGVRSMTLLAKAEMIGHNPVLVARAKRVYSIFTFERAELYFDGVGLGLDAVEMITTPGHRTALRRPDGVLDVAVVWEMLTAPGVPLRQAIVNELCMWLAGERGVVEQVDEMLARRGGAA